MSKEVKFDVVTRTTYVVTDVSPEDGITFDYTDWMEKARRMNLKWQLQQTHCKKCKRDFQDGDRMYMAITDRGNVFLCKECAATLRKKLGKSPYCKPENQHLNLMKK